MGLKMADLSLEAFFWLSPQLDELSLFSKVAGVHEQLPAP